MSGRSQHSWKEQPVTTAAISLDEIKPACRSEPDHKASQHLGICRRRYSGGISADHERSGFPCGPCRG